MKYTRTSKPIEEDRLLTIWEVAKALRVDSSTVRRYVKQGLLEAIVLPHSGTRGSYRVRQSTLNAILNTGRAS